MYLVNRLFPRASAATAQCLFQKRLETVPRELELPCHCSTKPYTNVQPGKVESWLFSEMWAMLRFLRFSTRVQGYIGQDQGGIW